MRIKTFILLILLFGSLSGNAQTDTIPVSRDYKTILVLPEIFDFSINGKELNFIESFPAKNASKNSKRIVLLSYNDVAPDSEDHTNYTVYTGDGLTYDFILRLVNVPERKRWSISKSMAENPQALSVLDVRPDVSTSDATPKPQIEYSDSANATTEERLVVLPNEEATGEPLSLTRELYVLDRIEYVRRRCYYNQFNKGKIIRYFAKYDDVFLWLENIFYENNEIYLQFRLENKAHMAYDVNFLKFSIASNYKNSPNNINKKHEPLFRYKFPKRVEGNSENYFMVVFDKFTLDRKKVLKINLDEDKGNRNLSLEIDHIVINNPSAFKL
ncbi:DUF4138 domain-containing protein [Maribacter sp. ACAM166]|uniref:DUF4138 domain-containing protein n=1 Tax=Maribacter sp. ACAM166 TaxID=2508996 RepID=UPI0010FE5845|nr:DUF4138 domain-containing protein [Maribacter sp. ACAM166]TLP81816.1 DUF4138 domain-containing protein [Maribacter sp. ACAM166]